MQLPYTRGVALHIQEGYFYHIKDSFFSLVQDVTLMTNREGGGYRPHFLAIRDSDNIDLYWMIPVSSRIEKYEKIYNAQIRKYHKCTKIVLGKCGGNDAAFLVQNAFPITVDFIDHIHTISNHPLRMHESTAKIIAQNLKENLALYSRGVNVFFTDINKVYGLMESHLQNQHR